MAVYVLGRPKYDPSGRYRGTAREQPNFDPRFPESHPVNQTFLRVLEITRDPGAPLEVEVARTLAHTFNTYDAEANYELVDVLEPGASPAADAMFLGYDLEARGFSLLGWSLELAQPPPPPETDPTAPIWIVQPLLRLIQDFFQPRLNQYGLFDDLAIAQYCLDCMLALQRVEPNLWENETYHFRAVAIWLLPTA